MHTITVSIQGDVGVTESVQVSDAEALPLFIRLKAVLQADGTATPARRRGRPRKARQTADVSDQGPLTQESEAADSKEA